MGNNCKCEETENNICSIKDYINNFFKLVKMMRYIYVLIFMLCVVFHVKGQQHNGEPGEVATWTMQYVFGFKEGDIWVQYCTTTDLRDEFKFCVVATPNPAVASILNLEEMSFGSMTPDGQYVDFDGNREEIESASFSTTLYFDNGGTTGCDVPILLINALDFPSWMRGQYSLKVIVQRVSTGEKFEESWPMGGAWDSEQEGFQTPSYVEIPSLKPETPPSGPTIEVQPKELCWVQGGTFDLTKQVTVTPADATVTYYDTDGTTPITNPAQVAMPTTNANNTDHKTIVTYYAKASNSDGESDPKPIVVTIWQKPEVTLAVKDKTNAAVCNDAEFTLQTTNVNSFVPKNNGFHYRSDATLDVAAGDTYKTSTTTNATYKVIVTSGDGVGNCVDSASVNVTVIPTIPGTAIQITSNLDENKKAICDGESLTLTASVTSSYSGTITYNWTKNGADFGEGGSKTDSPESQTNYAVSAELDGCPSNGVGSLLIDVNPLPPLSVTNPQASCGEPVDITQTGDGTFKYYTTAQLTTLVPDATKVGNGTYYVTKTLNGCTSEAKPVTATVHPLPTPTIAVDPASSSTEFCAGTELTLQCNNAGYKTYTWSGGDAVADKWKRKVKIVAGTGNKYSLTVTDGNNCQGTSNELTFTGKAAPSVTIDPVADACAGSEVTLTAHPVWVSGSGTVAWTGNVSTPNAATTTATLAGKTNSYSVTVTDGNKCTATAPITVFGNELKIINVSHPGSVKLGTTVNLDVAATWNENALGDTDATYSWTKTVSGTADSWTANTKKAVDTPDNSATYQVTVTKEGCSVTGEGEVEVTTAPFEVKDIASVDGRVGVCDGEELSANPVKWYVTAEGGRKSYTYTWTVPDGMTVEATDADTLKITEIDYTKLVAGTPAKEVSVVVRDGVNTATKKLYFQVRALPEVRINDKPDRGTVLACQGVQTELTASVVGVTSGSGDTYLWDGGSTSRIITVSTTDAGSTDYTVTATYAGCSNSATISVTVNELPDLTLKALLAGNEVSKVCPGTEITLQAAVTGVDAPSVEWLGAASGAGTNAPTLQRTVDRRQTYSVKYTDGVTSCSATKELTVDVHTPERLALAATPETTVCAGSPVVLTASNGATYQWSDGSGVLAGRTKDTLMIPQATNMKYTVNGTDVNGCEALPANLTIKVIEAPRLVLSKNTMDGCKNGSVDLATAVNTNLTIGGVNSLNILKVKKADGTESSVTVTEAGTYTLYLDAGGGQCPSNEEKVEVIFHALPTLIASVDQSSVCSGNTVTLSASSDDAETPTFTYNGTSGTSWTLNDLTNSGTTDLPKKYTVTAENSNRCRNTAEVTVTVKPLPNVQIADPDWICAGSEVILTASGADSYVWGDNGGTANGNQYTVRPSQTNKEFTVLGTAANGCVNTGNLTLKVKDAPTLEYAGNNGELTACLNSTVDLMTAFTGDHAVVECFTDDQATTPLQGGSVVTVDQEAEKTYYVREKVGDCVSELKPVKVKGLPVPTVDIAIDGGVFAVCSGVETTLTANATGAAEYTWSPGNEKTAAITITPTATTTYKVTVKSTNGCSAEDSQELIVRPLPALAWNQKPTKLSAGGTGTWSVTLDPTTTQPYTYTWTRNSDAPEDRSQSNYQLTDAQMPREKVAVYVTDGNGCRSVEITDEVPVEPVGGEMAVNVTATGNPEICQGGVQVLTAGVSGGQSPYSYVWYKDDVAISGETAASITVSEAATYKVEVNDAGGQTKNANLAVTVSSTRTAPTVVVPDLTIPSGNATLLLAEVTPAAGSYTYSWSDVTNLKDAGQVSLAYPETKILTGDTPYEVVVTDGNGCMSKAAGTVHVDDVNGFIVSATADKDKTCINNRIQLNTTLSGNNLPASPVYAWSPADGLSAADIANPEFVSSTVGKREYIVKVTGDGGRTAVAKVGVEVENKTAPTLQLAAEGYCFKAKITVTANGGLVKDYQWEIDGRAPILGGAYVDTLAVGDRHVKVSATAQNGCTVYPVEGDFRINALPVIEWAPGTPSVVDQGSSLTVTAIADNGASGDYTYDWSNTKGDGTASGATYTVTLNSTKTFKVAVTNGQTGCKSEEISTTVGVRAATPDVEIAVKSENVDLCSNGIALMEVTGVKGGQGTENDFTTYEYAWTLAGDGTVLSTEKSYAVSTAGTYTVKVTEPETGKSATKDITVNISSMQAPLVAGATLTMAKGQQTFLVASVTGGTPAYSYNWTPADFLATSNTKVSPKTAALDVPKDFTCYVTDANGCSGSGRIQVNVVEPTDPALFALTAKADNSNPCIGNTVKLTATPSRTLGSPTYEWVPTTDLSDATVADPSFTATTAGSVIYTVKATEAGGYSVTAQVSVTVKNNEAPRLELADAAGECAGEKLTVENKNTAVTVAGYHWIIDDMEDSGVTGNEYPLGAGLNQTVKVYAESTEGCASDTVSGQFTRKPLPTVAWNLKPANATVGDNFKVSVTSEAGVEYVWEYDYTPQGGTTITETGADMDECEIINAKKGTYRFRIYVKKDGCQSETLEHTVQVLDGTEGLQVTTDFTNRQVCENGSAVATATGHNGSGTYTYRWFAGTSASGTPIATGATVMLTPTTNGQKYVVEVNDGSETAVSSPITLTIGDNVAPEIAGGTQHVAAGHATVLLSRVTSGTATAYHWSSPNSLLASGEDTKAYPKTMPLSADETFAYYVTDANGCISKPAEVSVEVDASADALAIEATTDMNDLCRGNEARLSVNATQGTLSEAAVYEWTPTRNLTGANTASPVFKATATTTAGTYTYIVKVSDQGKTLVAAVDLNVKDADAPVIAWDPSNPTSFAQDDAELVMKTVVTTSTVMPYSYHWMKPQDKTETKGEYRVSNPTDPSYEFAVVMSDANGCRTTDTLTARVSRGGLEPIEIEVRDTTLCAGTETVELAVRKVAGPEDVTYQWESDNLSLTNADRATVTVNIAGKEGLFSVRVTVADVNNPDNKKEKPVWITIQKAPEIHLAERCVALHKDSAFVLTIANPGECDYLWRESVLTGDSWSTPEDKGDEEQQTVKMGDQDMRYILVATKDGCRASDTAMIYRIPDAPKIGIDTNTSRINIKLEWSEVASNDGYTVWSRKWDSYCMTAADGGVYAEEIRTTSTTWAETAMDTLEFYYVTADRNVCGTTYHSQTSDTVGYYLMDVKSNSDIASNVWYPLYFDMSEYGVITTADFIGRYLDLLVTVSAWEYPLQEWGEATTFYNPREDDPTSTEPVYYDGVFDLVYGTVIRLEIAKEGKIIQYGKLPKPITFKVEGGETGSSKYSLTFVQPYRADLKQSSDVVSDLLGKIATVSDWNFDIQLENEATTYYDPREDDPTSTDPVFYDGVFPLRALLPLKIENIEDSDIYWKEKN